MSDLVEVLALHVKAELKKQVGGKPLLGRESDWYSEPNAGSIDLTDIVRSCFAALEASGYRVVPVEHTNEMEDAGVNALDAAMDCENNVKREHLVAAYRAMLAAAPKVTE